MTIDMSQFIAVFFDEASEHLAALEDLLLKLNVANPDAEELNAIFRAAHSIKGGAATFGFSDLAEVTHILENLLDRIRKHETPLRPAMVDVFLHTGDVLQAMLAAHRGQGMVDPASIQQIMQELTQFSSEPLPAASRERVSIEIAAGDDFDIRGLLRELTTFGEIIDYEHGDLVRPWRFRVDSIQSSASILNSVSFLLDPARIKIFQGDLPNSAYGLFATAGLLDGVADVSHAVAAHGLFDAFVQRRLGFPQQRQHFRRHLPDWVSVCTI